MLPFASVGGGKTETREISVPGFVELSVFSIDRSMNPGVVFLCRLVVL